MLKRRSHTTFPLSASMATRRSWVAETSPDVIVRTYSRSPNATGADREPIGILHARLSPLGDQLAGRLVSADRPSRDGPRHSGQSLAPTAAGPATRVVCAWGCELVPTV